MANRRNFLNVEAKLDTLIGDWCIAKGESAKLVVGIGFELVIGQKFNIVHVE